MPDTKRAKRSSTIVLVASVANILFTLVALVIFVSRSDHARHFNCDLVSEALDSYTEGLILASSQKHTPDVDKRVLILKKTYSPILEKCK